MTLRRVVIVNDASTARGGATGLALLEARLLRARGIAVTLVAGDDGANPDLAAWGVEVEALGGTPLARAPARSAVLRGLRNGDAARLLARVIARHDGPGTAYHVHGWSKILSPAIFGPLARVADRTLIHAHDYFLACPNGGYMDYRAGEPCARAPLGPACLATACDKRSHAQKLWRAARTAGLRRQLDWGQPWAGVAMIHPGMAPGLVRGGVPERLLRTVRNPAEPFARVRIRAEANRGVLFVGRVEAEKGVEELALACRLAGLPLTVVGEGPLRAALAARHPEVAFTGWLGREGIAAEAARARLLAMPSRYPEPFGLVVAEAAASGLPVVLPAHALLAAEVEAAGIGLACDARAPAALAAALAAVHGRPDAELRAMSERAVAGAARLAVAPEDWGDAVLALLDAA